MLYVLVIGHLSGVMSNLSPKTHARLQFCFLFSIFLFFCLYPGLVADRICASKTELAFLPAVIPCIAFQVLIGLMRNVSLYRCCLSDLKMFHPVMTALAVAMAFLWSIMTDAWVLFCFVFVFCFSLPLPCDGCRMHMRSFISLING